MRQMVYAFLATAFRKQFEIIDTVRFMYIAAKSKVDPLLTGRKRCV